MDKHCMICNDIFTQTGLCELCYKCRRKTCNDCSQSDLCDEFFGDSDKKSIDFV